jgi:Uracil DNA glycosylase superfamily
LKGIMADDFFRDRGHPWEFDPGPPPGRRWARIFAETPNYRGLGRALSGRDEFRWHFGPMFYRGRLADGGARVLVIGQEGAQDESLGHHSFVGGSGARMQHFLRHIGITQSYLFLNTFVYPIFGQYNGADLLWLAQNPESPIVKHRHAIFDYLVERTDLRLVVAVGRAAKDSVHTWVKSRGGSCPSGSHDVSQCAASAISPRTRIVGVVHPGAGGKGGSTAAIIEDFKRALRKINAWASNDPSWLPTDPDGTRGSADSFKYRSAPIPFRDLPYGVAWRVGRGGTSSNRKDAQRGIQIFSQDGEYSTSVPYSSDAKGSSEGYASEQGDLPYEPPKRSFTEFDTGPGPTLARAMMGGEPGLAWPDFNALGAAAHPSFGYGPIYRGRPDEARILVLADQESHDDLFTFRAMTGDAGQRFQEFLLAMGITTSYLILRVLPVDTLGLSASQVRSIVDHAQVRKIYKDLVERVVAAGNPALALFVGQHARRLRTHVMPAGLPGVEMKAWRESDSLDDWKRALNDLRTMTYPKDVSSPSFDYDGQRGQIPRIDLPFGTLRWQGSSGDRGLRSTGSHAHDYYKILMPKWAFDLPPAELSASEQQAIADAPEVDDAGPID